MPETSPLGAKVRGAPVELSLNARSGRLLHRTSAMSRGPSGISRQVAGDPAITQALRPAGLQNATGDGARHVVRKPDGYRNVGGGGIGRAWWVGVARRSSSAGVGVKNRASSSRLRSENPT